jgi:predicted nucleic acid-binding protein
MSALICVDACLAVMVVVTEDDSPRARSLFRFWARNSADLIAPAFFEVEAVSILRQKTVLRKELTPELEELAVRGLGELPIRTHSVPGQRQRAWEIAREFDFPTIYDATYLALAELSGSEFWTSDERLFRRVKDRLPFARRLGDYDPTTSP